MTADLTTEQNKRTLILLGAGASVDAGVPASKDMTRKIVEAVKSYRNDDSGVTHALNYALGAMIAHRTALGQGVYDGIDVEDLFSAIQMLAERETLEIAPFVQWSPALEGVRPVPERPISVDQYMRAMRYGSSLPRARAPSEYESSGSNTYIFRDLQGEMIRALTTLLHVEPSETTYLDPLLSLGSPTEIATLNYDRAIEIACERQGKTYDTGIEQWQGGGDWQWAGDADVRLLKLHGSIDWREENAGRLPGLGTSHVVHFDPDAAARNIVAPSPTIVFGARGKLRAEGPFLAMLREFEAMLDRAERLLVVGYSMRDEHINVAITRWLNGAAEREITVIDPGFSDEDTDSFPYLLRRAALEWDIQNQREVRRIRLRVRREYAKDALAAGGFWEGAMHPKPWRTPEADQ
ncbi:MAG: SIR2 family protein [Actinomycetota bacterium]